MFPRTGLRLAAALLLAALAAAGASAAERQKFTLAALRRDGVIIPFASFDGRAWGVHWPVSDFGVPLPISMADVPPKWWGPQGPDAPWTARKSLREARRWAKSPGRRPGGRAGPWPARTRTGC